VATPLGGKSPAAGIGLGIYEVHPLDQAVGYATFAANGKEAAPFFVVRVKDRHGNEVYRAKADTSEAFSEDVAADTTYAMQKVVSSGTGTRAKIPGRPTAGKTGTTQDNKNAWFCGFTPQLATAVWVGRPSGKSLGSSGYGGRLAAPIFKDFMTAALEGEPVAQFPKPTQQVAPTPTATATPTPTVTPTASTLPTVLPTQSQPPSLPPVLPTSTPSASPTPSPTPKATPSKNGPPPSP
jgi:membrane peptidoglycan carboxypeptidase